MSDVEESTYEFDAAFQSKIASLFMRDTQFAMRTKDLIKPEYFTEAATGAVISIIQEHVNVYRAVPDLKILPTLLRDAITAKRIRPDMIDGVKQAVKTAITADLSNSEYVQKKVSDFARHQAVEQGMMASIPLLEKGDFDTISKIMREANNVGLMEDDGDYDYWREIASRTQKREDFKAGKIIKDGITTGYTGMDAYLYHLGWGRKELSCIMGPAKAGKSMSLGDFAKNASLAGYNVFYDSYEVSKEIIAERIDAANASVIMRELHKDPQAVQNAILALQRKNAGHLKLRDAPSGTMKPSALDRRLEKYRAEGVIFDLVVTDYADIMAAEYRSDNLQENLRTIYIDLRALAHKWNAAFLTATQTNRDGAKASTAKATDVGDDWNKARTVDILIGINATEAEKKIGEARLHWALSRNTEDGFSLRIRQDRQKMQFITKILAKE